MYYQKLINFNLCKKEYFMSFKLRSLTLAVATFSAMTAHSAGLDRSGQDITGFLQDGDYADIIYTHIDADIKGKAEGREVKDIAPSYDFFRYNVKSDVNDRVSVGVLYDEPFGAKVKYQGTNNFTGPANRVADNVATILVNSSAFEANKNRLNTAKEGANNSSLAATNVNVRLGFMMLSNAYGIASSFLKGIQDAINVEKKTAKDIKETLDEYEKSKGNLKTILDSTVEKALAEATPAEKEKLKQLSDGLEQSSGLLKDVSQTLDGVTSDNGATNVEVHTRNLTGLVGVKLGEKRNFQVYAGPAFQKLEGEVHLRGNAYRSATAYDAQISPDNALGWVAGVSYSKPEIALKAALTYRSEIEHSAPIQEIYPIAPIAGLQSGQALSRQERNKFSVRTPESYNLDFQTGLSAKHRLLGTLKVRYVPWSDFAITPPLYNQVSKVQYPKGLDIVNYAKDQWSAEIGLGKQVNDKLSVAGNVGWDSGAGNPTTSLGPVKGYYSVGLGAKYNITPNWALSAGAKYLKFGDAIARLPDRETDVGQFDDNDGYIVGVKLSYQNK